MYSLPFNTRLVRFNPRRRYCYETITSSVARRASEGHHQTTLVVAILVVSVACTSGYRASRRTAFLHPFNREDSIRFHQCGARLAEQGTVMPG